MRLSESSAAVRNSNYFPFYAIHLMQRENILTEHEILAPSCASHNT